MMNVRGIVLIDCLGAFMAIFEILTLVTHEVDRANSSLIVPKVRRGIALVHDELDQP